MKIYTKLWIMISKDEKNDSMRQKKTHLPAVDIPLEVFHVKDSTKAVVP